VGHEGGEEGGFGDAMRGAHDIQPEAEIVHRRIERAHEDVQHPTGEDHAAPAARVHQRAERGAPENGGRGRHAHDEADPDLVRAELVQEAREMEVEREGEVLEKVRPEAEDELA